MEALLGGVLFAAFLIAQIGAVVALRGEQHGRRSQTDDAIGRDRDAMVDWHSTP
jgi:hypothetical protein